MDKDEVMYGYALLDNSKHIISIDDVDRVMRQQHIFYCPCCHNEMYAALGEVKVPHFRHKGQKCQYNHYLHGLAEHVFYDEYLQCLKKGSPFYLELHVQRPCNKACVLKKHVDCKEHYIHKTVDLTKEYTSISLEPRVDFEGRYRRPDILLESHDGKQLWVEIWVSHETEEDKRNDGPIIEIKVERESDLEFFRQHKIIQSEGSDQDVRVFGIDCSENNLLADTGTVSNVVYPCERFFCYEMVDGETKTEIIDSIKARIIDNLKYRIILRLNWNGTHIDKGGVVTNQVREEDLREICFRRLLSIGDNTITYNNPYESLIVNEWKSDTLKSKPVPTPFSKRIHLGKKRSKSTLRQAVCHTPISDIEWVDLGLPSGTLWAKDNIEGKINFVSASMAYGAYLPSVANAEELWDCCTNEWNDNTKTLVLTGPNGNCIPFKCDTWVKSYWLNKRMREVPDCALCFHIGLEKHLLWINNKEVDIAINVRLVNRQAFSICKEPEIWDTQCD